MTQEEFNKILEEHAKWLSNKGGKRMVLENVSLDGLDLSQADMSFAIFHDVSIIHSDLSDASFDNAFIYDTTFDDSDLMQASFIGSVLRLCYFKNAKLRHACFNDSALYDCSLYKVDSTAANFYASMMHSCEFANVDFTKSDMTNTKIRTYGFCHDVCFDDVDFDGADLDMPLIKGQFGKILKRKMIGWKTCADYVLVKLEIPAGAVVFSISGKKCRTNKAKVIEIIGAKEGRSMRNCNFIYRKGRTYVIDDFNLKYNTTCSTGIHFFKTKKEAEEYARRGL